MDKRNCGEICSMTRRGFLGTSALAMGAWAGASDPLPVIERELNPLIREKLNVKLIAQGIVHESSWEGPCRTGTEESLSCATELARLEKRRERLPELAKRLGPEAHALEPVSMQIFIKEGDVRFVTRAEDLARLEADKDQVDLYVMAGGGRPQFTAIEIGRRFHKPIAFIPSLPHGGWITAMGPHLRAHGLEHYVPYDWEELRQLVHLLRVRKAIRKTKLLAVTEGLGGNMMCGVIENVDNLEAMKAQLGIDYARVSYGDFVKCFDAVVRDRKLQGTADAICDRLTGGARACHMTKENIKPTVNFYLTVRQLFREHGCNAFSIGCFELCSSTIPAQKRFTPCLAHSFLKDQGYPSACEGDLHALAAIALFGYLSRQSVHMGNPMHDAKNGRIAIHHDVPGRKMKGFDQPDMPYEVMHFTAAGWGATVRCDWNVDKGQPVTFGRFGSDGATLLIAHGEIESGYGLNTRACSHGVWIKTPKVKELFHKQTEVAAHHLAMVYGDYRKEIRCLGKMMGLEVVEIS